LQKSIHGLDNITAEGAEAFDGLMSIIEKLVENVADILYGQTKRQTLKEAKRYFKTYFFDSSIIG